jgi:FtsH-binding integral membrane protein
LQAPPSSIHQQPISKPPNLHSQNTQSPVSALKSNNLSVIVNSPNGSTVNSFGIDAASPALLLIGCFLIGLFLLAINPALPIFTALLALGPALLASEKGRNPLNWWCYGFLLFIVAIIHAAVTPAIPERAHVTKRQFWRGVRIAAIVLTVLCIVSYQFTEEGSPARAFLGIGALASIVMSIVAWTQKV